MSQKPRKRRPEDPGPGHVKLDPFPAQQRPLLGQRDALPVAPRDLAFEAAERAACCYHAVTFFFWLLVSAQVWNNNAFILYEAGGCWLGGDVCAYHGISGAKGLRRRALPTARGEDLRWAATRA